MDNLLLKTLSPQAAKVYRLLLKHQPLSAKQIGGKINIVPNTVYRDLRELKRLALVEELHTYPITYQAKSVPAAAAFFTSLIRQNFYETFGLSDSGEENLKITFFQNRKDFLKIAEKDISRAKKYCNIIISGHEVPAEFVLAQKKAVDRGVKIRKLLQQANMESIRVALNYQKMGMETRFTPLVQARIVIIDGQITQFGSYSPERQAESAGVRFDYPPLARLMDELFEQKWQQGKII
jgi:sugar-specific transcriptional regulator TrmB